MDLFGKKNQELARERTPTEDLAFIQHSSLEDIAAYLKKRSWAVILAESNKFDRYFNYTSSFASGVATAYVGISTSGSALAIGLYSGATYLTCRGLLLLLNLPLRPLSLSQKEKNIESLEFIIKTYERFRDELKAPLLEAYFRDRHGSKLKWKLKRVDLAKLESYFANADVEQAPKVKAAIHQLRKDVAFPVEIQRIDDYFAPYIRSLNILVEKLDGQSNESIKLKRSIDSLLQKVSVEDSTEQKPHYDYHCFDDSEELERFLNLVIGAVHTHVEEVLLQENFPEMLQSGGVEERPLLMGAGAIVVSD